MFSPFRFLAGTLLSASTVSASVLPSAPNLVSTSLKPPAVLETLNTNSTSLQDLTSPALSDNAECSISYGRNLNHVSCSNALAKISQVTTPMTFGERGTGTWDIALPHRYLSDDGHCAIDVKVNHRGAQRDVSNYLQITNAASAVLLACVDTRLPSTGGIVKQLGVQHRSLSVEISRSFSAAECHDQMRSAPPSYESCKEILDTMQWSNTLTTFGDPWQPGVQVQLPYFIISADRQCKMLLAGEVTRTPPVDSANWAAIWSVAVAVNEMCVKLGRGGYGKPQSFHKSLTLFLFGRGTDPPPEMLSSLNLSSSDLSMLSISNTTPPVADHRRSLSLPAREHRIEGK